MMEDIPFLTPSVLDRFRAAFYSQPRVRKSASGWRQWLALASGDDALTQDRELFQRRLSVLVYISAAVHIGVTSFNVLGVTMVGRGLWREALPWWITHFVVGLFGLALAWRLRRALLSTGAQRVLDVSLIVMETLIVAGMSFRSEAQWRPEFTAVFGTNFILMIRAALLPTSPLRTTWVGLVGVLPAIIATWLVHMQPDRPADYPPGALFVFTVSIFMLMTVIMSAFVSRVIYGLRRQIREAQQLGQYMLEEKIGEGGMGIVYRARHALLRRATAIKLLKPESTGPEALARFEREVQMTSRLRHPNTVAVYDYGRSPDGVFYYAMELLDGIDLEQIVSVDRAMPPGRVVRILAQAAEALAEAHDLGLIHRDVKPGNMILTERSWQADSVKIVDFGLVRDLEAGTGTAVSRVDALQGTPLYMSPEQIKTPGAIDARSDLYSLGAVGYFLLTGAPLFDARTIVEVCGHHLHTTPARPSARVDHEIPRALEDLVLACLEKEPDRRPRDARELRQKLLACEVAPWTDEDAHTWWKTRASIVRQSRRPVSGEQTTLAVDLRERGAMPTP
jgi:eukaryotic-like serine/threonine-protein kinase